VVNSPKHVATITPDEGWGFFERDFGDLASPFDVEVSKSTEHRLIVDFGWVGRVITEGHRYSGAAVVLTPRLDPFGSAVVVRVFEAGSEGPGTMLFDGMALSNGLRE